MGTLRSLRALGGLLRHEMSCDQLIDFCCGMNIHHNDFCYSFVTRCENNWLTDRCGMMRFAHNLAGLNYQSIAQKKLLDDLVVILTSAVLAHTGEALDILCGGKLGDLWHHPNPATQTTLVIDK